MLPRRTLAEFVANRGREVFEVADIPVPVALPLHFLEQHGAIALREKQQRQRGVTSPLRPAAAPTAIRFLRRNQLRRTRPEPVVTPEGAATRDHAHPLESVKIIVFPRADAGVIANREMTRQPGETLREDPVFRVVATAGVRTVLKHRPPRNFQRLAANQETRDSRRGHRAITLRPPRIPPAAVGPLGLGVMSDTSPPGLARNRHADFARLVKPQQRELRVGIVTRPPPGLRVGPRAVRQLGVEQEIGSRPNRVDATHRIRSRKNLTLETHDINVRIRDRVETPQSSLNRGILRRNPRVQHRQRRQARQPASVAVSGPIPTLLLTGAKIGQRFLHRPRHIRRRNRCPSRRSRHRTIRHRHRPQRRRRSGHATRRPQKCPTVRLFSMTQSHKKHSTPTPTPKPRRSPRLHS